MVMPNKSILSIYQQIGPEGLEAKSKQKNICVRVKYM